MTKLKNFNVKKIKNSNVTKLKNWQWDKDQNVMKLNKTKKSGKTKKITENEILLQKIKMWQNKKK